MSFDGNGVYTRAGGTTAVAGQKITASMHETEWADAAAAFNECAVKDVANTFTASPQTIESTDAGSLSSSLKFKLYRKSATPAAADGLGQYNITGRNSSAAEIDYAGIHALIAVETAGSEEGILSFRNYQNGAYTAAYNIREGFYRQGGNDLGSGTANFAHIGITDGVTAPTTVSGVAQIYVDSADGDLKIKYGDGTVKTIVVDT